MLKQLRYLGNLIMFTLSLGALIVVAAPRDQLQDFNAKIEQARNDGATVYAPMSLRLAENEMLRAHQLLRTANARPLLVEHALEMVNYRIEELRLVLAIRKNVGLSMTEESALSQVRESHPEMSPRITRHDPVD